MISRLSPSEFKVKSLTTIATPHRGVVFESVLSARSDLTETRVCICGLCLKSDWTYAPRIVTAENYTNRRIAIQLPKVYRALEFFGFRTGAFSQLTRDYMQHTFNPNTPDVADVK